MCMYGVGVDINRFFKGLWTGEKQQPLGSTYDPDMILALDGMDIEPENETVDSFGTDVAPVPAE